MRRFKDGFATVEAAFVISIILFVLTAILLFLFYLHDRLVLFETALLDAERIEHMVEEPVSEQGKLLEDRLEAQSFLRITTYRAYVDIDGWKKSFMEEVNRQMFLTDLSSVEIGVEDRQVTLSYQAAFRLPVKGVVKTLLRDILTFSGKITLKRGMDREELVRLCRSIKRK